MSTIIGLVSTFRLPLQKSLYYGVDYQYIKTAAGYREDSGGRAVLQEYDYASATSIAGTFFIVNSYTCECSSTSS